MDEMQELQLEDAKQRVKVPTDDDLKSISSLAELQLTLEASLDELEIEASNVRGRLTEIREIKLPNALEDLGMSEFKLKDGTSIQIKKEVYAGITQENRDLAFKWLEETQNDGIIKNEVSCPFGKGQDSEAKRLVDTLTSQGYSFTNSRSVHPQTLRAFVKKQLEQGAAIPTDLFSIHEKKLAKITTPRER